MSLAQVAREAGVAVSTVSRYVKGELNVAPETAQRIDTALSEAGFAPDVRPTQNLTIGLVVPALVNPYFATLADAVADSAAADGVEVVTMLTGSSVTRERNVVGRLAQLKDVSGLIYLGMNRTNDAVAGRVGNELPVVLLDELIESAGPRVSHVTADSFGGAYQATSHLLALGHRQIAHLGGPLGLHTADERAAGYRAALAEHGVAPDEELELRGPFDYAFGTNYFAAVSRARVTPTAVFSASDISALGLLEAARRTSVKVPQELSLIGCDGIAAAEWTTPQLSTVAQPAEAMARRAVEEIQRLVGGAEPRDHVLSMQLVLRDSTISRAAG